MKKLFIGIFLLVITYAFSEGKSWDDPPQLGELFMVSTDLLEGAENFQVYFICRYKGPNLSFEEEFKEWHKVTPEILSKWLDDGKNIINIADTN